MKEKINWQGQEYEMQWFDSTDFSKLDNIIQVYGFLFDKNNKICIVRPTEERGWRLPGGKIEKGEDWQKAIIREADEEADVGIDKNSLIPIGYIKVIPLSKNSKEKIHYLLRVVGKITKINEQTEDIAEGLINERIFINPKDFLDYCPWGKIGEIQRDKAIGVFEECERCEKI